MEGVVATWAKVWLEQLTTCTAIMTAFARLCSVAIPLAYDSRKAGRRAAADLVRPRRHVIALPAPELNPRRNVQQIPERVHRSTSSLIRCPFLTSWLGRNSEGPDNRDGFQALAEQCRRCGPTQGRIEA